MLTATDSSTAAKFKQMMLERGIPVCETIVFGSRARGDAEPDSDLDVMVIVDHVDRHLRREISDCAWQAGYDAGIVVQSVVLTREEAETGPERSSLLMLAVEKEGIAV